MWLPLACPQLGAWPAALVCALTGNLTGNYSVCRLALDPLSHTNQGYILLSFKMHLKLVKRRKRIQHTYLLEVGETVGPKPEPDVQLAGGGGERRSGALGRSPRAAQCTVHPQSSKAPRHTSRHEQRRPSPQAWGLWAALPMSWGIRALGPGHRPCTE